MSGRVQDVYLGLGANLGDRSKNIEQAVSYLEKQGTVVAVSSLHETEPWGITDQPLFLNAALHLHTHLSANKLLVCIFKIEKCLKRERLVVNGPRTIDIDILLYGDAIIDDPGLQVPHPGMHERTTVLLPLVEIAPEVVHPVLHKTVAELLEEI